MASMEFYVDLDLNLNKLEEVKIEEPISLPNANSSNLQRVIFGNPTGTNTGNEPTKALMFCYLDGSTYRWEAVYRYKLNNLRLPDGDIDVNNNFINNLETNPDDDKSAANVAFVKNTVSGLSFKGIVLAIQDAPPVSPTDGDKYIVGTGSGDWAGENTNIATYVVDTWTFEEPANGWAVKNADDGHLYIFSEDLTEWVDFGETLNYNAGDGIDIDGTTISVLLAQISEDLSFPGGSGLTFNSANGLVVNATGVLNVSGDQLVLKYNQDTFVNVSGELVPLQLIFAKSTSPLTATYGGSIENPYTTEIDLNIGDGLEVESGSKNLKVKTPASSSINVSSNGVKLNYDSDDFGVDVNNNLYIKDGVFCKSVSDIWTQSGDAVHSYTHNLNNASPTIDVFVYDGSKFNKTIMKALAYSNIRVDLYPQNGNGKTFKVVVVG